MTTPPLTRLCPVARLSGFALNVAVELAEGYAVTVGPGALQGVRSRDGMAEGLVRDFVGQGPHADDIMDKERISTEIAGAGWAALHNDCFCSATYGQASHGATRREAAMRCHVRRIFGDVVALPQGVDS